MNDDLYSRFEVTMSHDNLCKELGEKASSLIHNSGFVIVPKRWRDSCFDILTNGVVVLDQVSE